MVTRCVQEEKKIYEICTHRNIQKKNSSPLFLLNIFTDTLSQQKDKHREPTQEFQSKYE